MVRRLAQHWLALASRPAIDRWILVVAVLLALPAVPVGFTADDAMLRVRSGEVAVFPGLDPTRWDLFVFVRDDAAQREALMDHGFLSWWTAPGYRLGFLRPLSSITHALDFWLWPTRPGAMVLHSIAWFVAMLLSARAVFRRWLPPVAASTALMFYALDDARGPVVGYISNRNALVMATFGFLAIALYDRGRRDGWRPAAWAAPLAFGLGLLAGEGTVATLGYLGAHALFLDRAPVPARARALAPFAVLTIAWAAAYRSLGYGSSGSGIYIDPGGETSAWLAVAPARVLALLGAQWFGPWSDFQLAYTPVVAAAIGLFCAAVVATVLRLVQRHAPDRPRAWSMILGAALACVPLASTFPADRLLGFVGLGGAAVVAMLAVRWAQELVAGRPWSRPAHAAMVAFVAVHGVVGPLWLPVRVRSMVTVREALASLDVAVPEDPSIVDREVIVAFAPNDGPTSYLGVTRVAEGRPAPRAARVLATSTGPVTFTRPDATSLRVVAHDGLLTTPIERMARAPQVRFTVGERLPFGGARSSGHVDIEAVTADGRPAAVRFVFPRPLEDPSYVWRAWEVAAFVPWRPPAVGEQIELEGFDLGRVIAASLDRDP